MFVDRRRQLLDLGRGLDQAEVVAQPLHQRTGDRDRALEGVDRWLIADLVAERRQQAALAGHRLGAGVEQHEAAGAIGVLRLAGAEARLAEEGRLLVSEVTRDRHAGEVADGLAVHGARGLDGREHRARDAHDFRISGSQSRVWRFMSIVRLALVTSVTWTPPLTPPVRFQMHQVSMLPNSRLPARQPPGRHRRCRGST